MPACPFCELIKTGTSLHSVYENDLFIVIPDKESLGFGHCMIIPKIHIAKIYELDDDTYTKMFMLAKELSNMLKKLPQKTDKTNYISYAETGGLSPVISEISVAYMAFGSGLQHAHLHLVPYSNPDILMNPAIYIVKLSEKELAGQAEFIRNFINRNQIKLS